MSQVLGMSRYDTKTLVYSMQYGAGVTRIMNVFGVTETEARKIKDHYFNTYPGFRTLSDMAQATARSRGNIRLWSGRYRHFQDRQKEAHKALNSVIQGGAADVVERRMSALRRELNDGENFRMLLQVHDSVIGEVKIGQEKKILSEWRRIMMDVGEPFDKVKFAVEIKPFGGE
jgi:DNA polymerase-1